MELHPLTPMTNPDIRRWLARQCGGRVGHVGHATVRAGAKPLRDAVAARGDAGEQLAVIDAIADADLRTIGEALAQARLLTGGTGIALGLPDNFRRQGLISGQLPPPTPVSGRAVLLSGSCSQATRAQVLRYAGQRPAFAVDTAALMTGEDVAARELAFVQEHADSAPLVYSSAEPEAVLAVQNRFGRDAVAGATEGLFGDLARQTVADGVRRLVVPGGETSGAVVTALQVAALEIGLEIAPGVPALLTSVGKTPLALALKSGNFGDVNFFAKAVRALGSKHE